MKKLIWLLPFVVLFASCGLLDRHALRREAMFQNNYFSFTNRLAQRDVEPMDLAELGKVLVLYGGKAQAWRCVTTAYAFYSQGAPLEKAGDVLWLVDQPPRVRDTAWMIRYREEWE